MYALNEEQQLIIETATAFTDDRLRPNAERYDQEKILDREALQELASLGFGGIYAREDVGGSGLGRLDAALIFEALSKGCIGHATFLSIHNMVAWMIDSFASEDLRQRFATRLCAGELIGSYCLTEPNHGSDAGNLTTRAEKDGDSYVINGAKVFISGAGFSDVYIVMARSEGPGPKGISAFLVEKGTPGLSFGKNERKMGWNAQPTAMVSFEDCRIPAENIIGQPGQGFSFAMQGLNGGRLNIAACSLGGAQEAFDRALSYSRERKQFGQPIGDFQNTAFALADMETSLQASRTFLYTAAEAMDAGRGDTATQCAMAKRFVTDACFDVANRALQIHGGYGYLSEYGIERIVRDLRVHQILEGTNEIMRLMIARGLQKQ